MTNTLGFIGNQPTIYTEFSSIQLYKLEYSKASTMSNSPGQTRPNKVAKSNSNPKKVVPSGVAGSSPLVKHQSFMSSPNTARKLVPPRRDYKLPNLDTSPQDNTLIRYMDAELFRTVTGQSNPKLITKLDLSCPPNKPNSRKFPYIDHTDVLTNLIEMNLSGNVLSRCDRLAKLTQLQKLYISHNKLESIDGIGPLINLTVLDVSYNQIQRVPTYLPKKLTALRELYLAGNKLVSLPDVIKLRSLTGLIHFSVEDNPLSKLPHYRGMIVYGMPTLELLDGDPISKEEKAESGVRYARETLELHEAELLLLRERLQGVETELEETLKARDRLEKSDTHNRSELQVKTEENRRLDDELTAQRRLMEQKTNEMNRVMSGRLQLENELSFYKLDSKVENSRYTDLYHPNFNLDSENSDMEEIPYLGQARFMQSTTVHRTYHPDMSRPAHYEAMPGSQYGQLHSPDPADPAHIARLVQTKEQGLQASSERQADLRHNIGRHEQGVQACVGQQWTPLSGEESDQLQGRLAAIQDELRALRRQQQEQLNLSQNLEDSDEETASYLRDAVFEDANEQELVQIADLIAKKELAMRDMDQKLGRSVSMGEQMDLMQQESADLSDQLIRERAACDKLVADKAELVEHLNRLLNIQHESVIVQTMDESSAEELELLREQLATQELEIAALSGEHEGLRLERNDLWRRLHKETAEVGVSVRCHQVEQGTNTPRPRPKLSVSPGSRVDIPSGDQLWEREKQGLLEHIEQMRQDLHQRFLENQVLQDAVDTINLEKNRALDERDIADEDRFNLQSALTEAETQAEALRRNLAVAGAELERLDNLERDKELLEGRLREEEQDRLQAEEENRRLKDKATQLKQLITQSENARQSAMSRKDSLEEELRNIETREREQEQEIRELRDYISEMERDRNKQLITQGTQTLALPNYGSVMQQLRNLTDTVGEHGEPGTVADAIHQLPRPHAAQFPEERVVGELSDQLVNLLGGTAEELERLTEQMVETEAENADMKGLLNNKLKLCNKNMQTDRDPRLDQLEEELYHLQALLEAAEQELAALKRKRGVEVSTQVKPRVTHQTSQVNIADTSLVRENEELAQQLITLERDKGQLLADLEQSDLGIRAREDLLHNYEDDIQHLITENDELKRELNTVGVQTSRVTMDANPGYRDQGVSPREPQDLSAISDDVGRLNGIVNHFENHKTFDRNSLLTESIDINDFETRPPHRNVSIQADLFDTQSRGMQAGGYGHSAAVQTFPQMDNSGTQTYGQGGYYHSLTPVDSPLSISECSVFSRRAMPPNRAENRPSDSQGIQVNSKTTSTRRPGGTGRRQEFREIFINEEIVSSSSEEPEEPAPLDGSTEKITRVHYRTSRGAQTERASKPKDPVTRSDTELHNKIYISKKKRRHRARRQLPRNTAELNQTVVVLSATDSDSESVHSVVEPQNDVNYIYVPSHNKHRTKRVHARAPNPTDYSVHVTRSHARPAEYLSTRHYHTTEGNEYFCNIPQHVAMEDEIDRLEALLGISNRRARDRNTRVDISVRHNVLDRLSDIEKLLKEKVDNIGKKQEEQERLNLQLAREQQHLSQTAAELNRARDELQQINVHLRGRSQRTDVITGQTSHGGMTPQLETLQRRIESLTGILQEAEVWGNEEVGELQTKRSRIQREINQQLNELDSAKRSLQEVNEQKRAAKNEYYKCLEDKAELEEAVNNLKVAQRKEEGTLRHLRTLIQDLRTLQAIPDESNLAVMETKRSQLESQLRQLQQNVNSLSSQEERGGRNELEVVRASLRQYKRQVQELREALQGMEELEQQNEAYQQEILELRTELNRIKGNQNYLQKQYNSNHTHTIDKLLHNLQSQLSHLQDNISTELYKDEEILYDQVTNHNTQGSPMDDLLTPLRSEILPDLNPMRMKNHQAILDQINREHESLMQYLQGNMQEGERSVLNAQHETMQGVFDLKRQIEQLQNVLDQHKTEQPLELPFEVELEFKAQREILDQLTRKVDKISDKSRRPRPSPSPRLAPSTNPFFPTSPSRPLSSLDPNQGSYGYNSFAFESPSKDVPYNPDLSYLSQTNDTTASISLRRSYETPYDNNSPPTPLAPADSILFEDPPSDASPPERRYLNRSFDRRQDLSQHRPDTTLSATEFIQPSDSNHSIRSLPSTHSTSSLLRLHVPDEHKLKLLELRNSQEVYSRPNL